MKPDKRPGRSGVSYDDVVVAAERLVSNGERATVRAVREQIGSGSSSLILAHLHRWQVNSTKPQGAGAFSVSPRDVDNLSALDFACLINHLVRVEARRNELRASPDTTRLIDVADSGVDGRILWEGGPQHTTRLPNRHTIWQTKSGRRLGPSELRREIERRDGGGLKQRIADVFTAGGAYVLFSAADMTVDMKLTREAALRETVRWHLPVSDPIIRIVSGDEIASWADDDLWARTFLIRAAGREHPSMLLTYEEWMQQPSFSHPYVWSDDREPIAKKIQTLGESPGTIYRLDGPPGLGKTRLVLEALRPIREAGISVVYFDARHPGAHSDLLRALPNWRHHNAEGIIVVDDCDFLLHQQIARELANSRMSAVTIDYHRESSSDATLLPMQSATIDQIVRAQAIRLDDGDIRRIVEYAQGWPLMATNVLAAVVGGRDHIAELDDDQLTRRLIEGNGRPEEGQVLRLLSIFDHVGFQDDVKDEWEVLRTTFTPGISREDFFTFVRSYQRQGLIVTIGRYWRVTPPPLAIRLSREWLDNALPEAQEQLFSGLPQPLSESLARRFDEISTPTAVDLASDLLEVNGRFGTLGGILGRSNARVFQALANVNPPAAAATSLRVFGPLSDDALAQIDDSSGRQTLVFALEHMAFHQNCFDNAARALFRLARNENAANSNNSRGTLVKLFAAYGSQTEAPPTYRIAILDEIMSNDGEQVDEIVAAILSRVLSFHQSYVVIGPEFQGGRPKLEEWKPATWGELFDYYAAAVDRALLLAKKSDTAYALAREVIADAIPTLVRYRRWNDLMRSVGELSSTAWPKAVERLTWSLRYDLRDASEDDRTRAKHIMRLLEPPSLADQIRLYVSSAPHDLEQRGNDYVDVSVERAVTFASQTIKTNQIGTVFQVITPGEFHRLAFSYAQAVAQQTTNLPKIADIALDAYVAAATPKNPFVLMAVFSVLRKRDPAYWQRLIERVASNSNLLPALPSILACPQIDTNGTELLAAAYLDGRLSEPPPGNIFFGKSFWFVDSSAIRKLFTVFFDNGWYAPVATLLMFGIDGAGKYEDIFSRLVLESTFLTEKMDDVHEWSLFEASRRLIVAGDPIFLSTVAERLMSLALSDKSFSAKRRVADLWALLLEHEIVWKQVRHRYHELTKHDRWKLLVAMQYTPPGTTGHRLALEVRPIDDLMAFATAYDNDVPWFLARYGHIVEERHDQCLERTELLRALLEVFGTREDVLNNLDASLHSFLSVGSRAVYYEKRIQLIAELPTFNRPKLIIWKERLKAQFEAERRRVKARDDEFESGIF